MLHEINGLLSFFRTRSFISLMSPLAVLHRPKYLHASSQPSILIAEPLWDRPVRCCVVSLFTPAISAQVLSRFTSRPLHASNFCKSLTSVKYQYRVAPSEGKKQWDLEIVWYLRDATGPRNLVIDLIITHDRHGRSTSNPHTNGHLTHPDSLDRPLEIAARAKITKHQAAYSNNNSTSFMPRVASTSGRLHSELLRLLFLHTGSSGNRGRESGGEKEKECTTEWKTLVTLVTLVSLS